MRWDPDKARRNLAEHGVAFDLAKKVFDDPLHLIVPDRFEDGEQRWHAIGMVGTQVILLVCSHLSGRGRRRAC
jgi:hypothetical protein